MNRLIRRTFNVTTITRLACPTRVVIILNLRDRCTADWHTVLSTARSSPSLRSKIL